MKKTKAFLIPNARFAHLMRWFGQFNFKNADGNTMRVCREVIAEAQALIDGELLDYQARNEQGNTVVGDMINAFNGAGEDMGQQELSKCVPMFGRMLDHGCNPLLCAEGEIETILRQDEMRDKLLLFAAEREAQGRGLRDEQGGNLYHAMARFDLICFSMETDDILMSYTPSATLNQLADPEKMAAREPWLLQARNDGSTLLHVVWERETLDYNLRKPNRFDAVKHENTLNGLSVMITKTIVNLGGDVLLANNAGVSAWDLMNARDLTRVGTAEVVYDKQALMKIAAGVEARLLEGNTLAPKAPGRMGTRL